MGDSATDLRDSELLRTRHWFAAQRNTATTSRSTCSAFSV
ncbi:hypothetical protein PF005_g3668 [Phytophthora fragariae]|uniref:Uncharacterized protein n=1 Tax=Phytophthora fragariae TaxID=53985 RepID=A0A6A3Z6B2_9STRA|nr:hypothetical protein PF003_g3506 [Phytophthora fragariae]KAE9112334.1 hypothetical protein PF007_g11149 [Phytophthora fragariae]KAE9112348.1 hypothetical protein PF010_g10472 [Phytophthora fragariae]KAE9144759.1 hypothetical protein PF006_g10337 [Phytophthora fragariae]KAE9229935.1 hypothetical protein PF005_g3668 [Phytophthora fragariae]